MSIDEMVRELAKTLGRTPTQKELRQAGVGKWTAERIVKRLGLPQRKPGQRTDYYDDDHPEWSPRTEG